MYGFMFRTTGNSHSAAPGPPASNRHGVTWGCPHTVPARAALPSQSPQAFGNITGRLCPCALRSYVLLAVAGWLVGGYRDSRKLPARHDRCIDGMSPSKPGTCAGVASSSNTSSCTQLGWRPRLAGAVAPDVAAAGRV